MQRFNKAVALLLCMVMLIGFVPVSASATEDRTIYVLAGGDFQEAGDHAGSAENVRNILAQISQKYDTMDGFLFVGDYDCETHESDDNGQTAAGITALMGAVQDSYPNITDANSILVQGNHDIKEARIDATGGYDFDGYSVFVMNEDDYPDGGGTQAGVQALANSLKTWLNDKLGEGYDAPIFITSHLPLAFSPRTNVVGDGKYARLIFDVLNTAAGEGLNIIFMHGHNHAYGNDNYLGGEAIYLPKGEKINIAELGSQTAWTEETLNFTYMNAGYVGYYNDWNYVTTEGTDKLTMTVFAINGSEVTVERYSANGLYDLKSEGRDGRYVRDREASADSLGLAYNTTVYASPQTIALTEAEDYGDIGSWVGVTAEPADDVTTSGNDWTTITEPVAGSTTYEYTQATSITAGEEYVIVGDSNAVALMDENGSMSSQNVTISGSTMTSNTALTEWTFSSSTSGTIYNGTRYLRYSNGGFSLNRNSSTTFDITDNGSNFRIQSGSYSFCYNGSSWTRSGKNTARYVRLYQLTDTTTTDGTNGLYAYLDGELTYPVEVGTSADDALAMVKEGIAIQYATAADYSDEQTFPDDGEGMTWTLDPNYDPNVPGDYEVAIKYGDFLLGTAEVVVPASTTYYAAEGNGLYLVDMNTTEANALAAVKAGVTVYSADNENGTNKTAIGDDEVTWEWVDKYNGADSGPYTVEILKDGTSLGTVEVKVDVRYETGIETDWTYIGETEATGGTTTVTYTLDTDGLEKGVAHKYVIVAQSQNLALYATSTANSTTPAVTISADGKTLTTTTRDYEYYFVDTYGFTKDGSKGLYGEEYYIRYGNRSGAYLDGVTHNGNGYYNLYDNEGTWRGLTYDGSRFTVAEPYADQRVRLYKFVKEETVGGTPGGPIYALIEGPEVYTVTQGSSATKALAAVKAGITGYIATAADGTGKTELSDSDLTWKWKNTFNGNATGSYWVEISYQGKVLGTVEVRVEPGVVNNYPEYPDEGSVKVRKTGTGIDFQSSGIAQVEISASGVPIKKGADVIVMLDTSSSMTSHTVTGSSKTRAQVLEESLKSMIAQFKTPGADGQLLDIRVAIADFNGFYGENHNASGTPYDRDAADMMSDDISYNANSEAKVYTGDGTLGAGAFIPVEDLAASYTLNYTSGTNYDYAFDAIYQLGTAIKETNTEERDLYVIFMSDGAAMQWNYYHSQGASSLWNNWITGAWTANQLSLNCNTHAYYYDEIDHNGDGMRNEHRMANAIKGDPAEQFEVIRKNNTLGTPTGETNMYMVPGLGAKMFSISFDAQADTNVTEESMDKSIASLASEQTGTTQYYYKVTTAAELDDAFDAIGSEIAYAAYNARFVDQMGDDYDLQMKTSTYSVVDGTSTTSKTLAPKIEIISYDIYTRQDYLNGTITENKIGDRKGTYKILETVTFSADGTEAYSDQINGGKTNILADGTQAGYVKGVIYAKTFLYNTNATGVAVTGVSIPTGKKADGTTTGSTNVLPAETFYWKMGTVQTSELAMRYYVYLTGSMEGTREGGSYPTNEYATLYYDNYLGNPCRKDTVSPVMPWKEANVSYAFYLVNDAGQIIVNQTTGQTGSFANKIAVTNPVVYETVLLNSDEEVSSIDIASLGVLPEGYTLYDFDGDETGATYTVTINSNTTGSWEITTVKDVATTYVTQYDPKDASAYSNDRNNSTVGDDYTHTVVWFAVLWKVQALPDTVVIDYGLPVDISVLTNDMFGENGKLAGVGAYSDSVNLEGHDTAMAAGFGTTYNGEYGAAKTNTTTGKVRYTPANMQMDSYEKFAYAVNYTGNENAGCYYDTVTVIPATTIYYEDSFVDTKGYVWQNGGWVENASPWTSEGDYVDGTQAEDRPGQYSLNDANNIYGYDDVYAEMSTFSMGSAKKLHVNYDQYGTFQFTFYGTGFDLISMTSARTGGITMDVYVGTDTSAAGTLATYIGENGEEQTCRFAVDTYYGYKYENDEWVVTTPDDPNAIYQVPVMEVADLTYGQYTVVVKAQYAPLFDHGQYGEDDADTGKGAYDFYLDAIRIYDPANDGASDGAADTTIEDAYKADGEGWPSYIELRNSLIEAESFTFSTTQEGAVFIDGKDEAAIADYTNYGPNNEVYLANGQSIAFMLSCPETVKNIHIGVSAVGNGDVTYEIKNVDGNAKEYSKKVVELKSATDMYYDLTSWKGDIIVITNTGDGILSLTNIKSTYTEKPGEVVSTKTPESGEAAEQTVKQLSRMTTFGLNAAAVDAVEETVPAETAAPETQQIELTSIYMTAEAAELVVAALNAPDQEEAPEPTIPEESEPEETEPEVTEPEETEPEVFQPKLFVVSVSKDSVKVGQKVQVTITTSSDVDYVTVNGKVISRPESDWNGVRTWTLTVTAERAGTMDLNVVCYNTADVASEPVTRQIKVRSKNGMEVIYDLIFDIFH